MQVKLIEGATRIVGKSQGYIGLPLRDERRDDNVTGPGTPVMVSAWEPLPDELERLNKGAAIEIQICGTMHPPIFVGVGKVPE